MKLGKQIVICKVSSYWCAWHPSIFQQLHQRDAGENATRAKKDLEAERVCLYDCAPSDGLQSETVKDCVNTENMSHKEEKPT